MPADAPARRAGVGAALDGVRVISMAEQYPGPLCTYLLADLGAEVVQLERPGGDPQREVNEWLFRATSLGKQSLELDLKQPADLAAAHGLVQDADVFIEGFRPGVAERLGMGFEALSALNPRLVYCSISGYGQTGPYRLLAGHNVNYEAVTGVLDAVLRPELDVSYFAAAPPLGDVSSGMLSALGIVAGLRSVEATGEPVYLDIAIADSIVLAIAPNVTRALNGAYPWSVREPGYGIFECSESSIALGVSYEDHFWHHICDVLGLAELTALPRTERLERRDEIRGRMSDILRGRPASEWVELFGDGVPCSPVWQLHELPDDPQIASRGLIVDAEDELGRPFRTVGGPFSRGEERAAERRRVPVLGSGLAAATAGETFH